MPQVFITGASGWIGTATVTEFLNQGYKVLALARSEKSAAALQAQGAEVLRGNITDYDILRQGAATSDASIHMAFPSTFDDFKNACVQERAALQAIADGIGQDSMKPFVMTTGCGAMGPQNGLHPSEAKEYDIPLSKDVPPISERFKNEEFALDLAAKKGMKSMVIRLPPTVHGKGDTRFITELGRMSAKYGKTLYVDEGNARWPAAHLKDVAVLYRLAVENGQSGGIYHASADKGVPMKSIMQAIGQKLKIPTESSAARETVAAYPGILGVFIAVDCPLSSERTRKELGWKPKEIGLLDDIEQNYFEE